MTEPTGAHTSVLLPAARVGLYVLDAELRESAKALSTDWRFARVTFEIHEGDVEDAIKAYHGTDSPELLLVETKTIEDGFAERLEVLAGSCSDHTSAVVIGPVNDVYLYRKLITMGVSDYLVRPIRKDVLAEVIAKALTEKLGTSESRLIAFTGSKGGVGTSTLAQSTAWATANRLDQKTIILDAAGGWSYLSVAMGGEPVTTLEEAARAAGATDQDSFKRMIYSSSDKLSVLCSGSDMMLDDPVSADSFEHILTKLMVSYPVVIVDLSGASANVKRMVMHKAHEVVIVTTPTLPALRSARSLMMEIKDVRGGSEHGIDLVINMTGLANNMEVAPADIAAAMGRKPVLDIPFAPKIFAAAETQGKPLSQIQGSEEITAGLVSLAGRVLSLQETVQAPDKAESKLLGGLLGKLKAK